MLQYLHMEFFLKMYLLKRQVNKNENASSDVISFHYALHFLGVWLSTYGYRCCFGKPFSQGRKVFGFFFSNLFICIIELEFERPGILGLTNNILKF